MINGYKKSEENIRLNDIIKNKFKKYVQKKTLVTCLFKAMKNKSKYKIFRREIYHEILESLISSYTSKYI